MIAGEFDVADFNLGAFFNFENEDDRVTGGDSFVLRRDFGELTAMFTEQLAQHDFRIDATIFEKAKAYAKVKADENYFYKLAWFLHLKHVAPIVGTMQRRPILLVAASLATKRRMEQFHDAVDDVAAQVYPGPITTGMWASSSDPCLWAVDYCSWAIQRMWEMSDARSYDLIKARISTEFDVWRSGQVQP